MPYLSIGGVTVRVALDSISLRYVNAGGDEERSPAGSLEGGPLAVKREWAMATTPVLSSEVDAWVGLLEGRGHSWPFDANLYSSRGRGPSLALGATFVTSGMKYGAGCIFAETGVTDLRWSLGLVGSSWTLLWWSKNQSEVGSVWTHWVLRGDGATWQNGASVAPSTGLGEVDVVFGDIVITGADGSDWLIDDVVAMPFPVPDAWAPLMYTQHNAAAWSALPRLSAAGTFSSDAVTVRGKVTDTRVIRYSPNGTPTNGHTIQFTLREV